MNNIQQIPDADKKVYNARACLKLLRFRLCKTDMKCLNARATSLEFRASQLPMLSNKGNGCYLLFVKSLCGLLYRSFLCSRLFFSPFHELAS